MRARRSLRSRRRGRRRAHLALFGEQTQLVDAGGADVIHDFGHGAVLGTGIGADVHALVGAAGQLVLDLVGQLIGRNLFADKKHLAESINKALEPIRQKRRELEANLGYVNDVLAEGAKRARVRAQETMAMVKEKMHLR